jgi:hypothetical protein
MYLADPCWCGTSGGELDNCTRDLSLIFESELPILDVVECDTVVEPFWPKQRDKFVAS